jgi:hypothetical protein
MQYVSETAVCPGCYRGLGLRYGLLRESRVLDNLRFNDRFRPAWSRLRRLTLPWRDIRGRKIPVRCQDLESPQFLALVGFLIGPELLDQAIFVRIGGGRHGRVLIADGDAIVPARILGHVIRWRLDFDREYAAALGDLLQQRIVVLEEELQEFLLMAPRSLVIILHGVGLVRRDLRRRALAKHRPRNGAKQQRK